MKKAAQKSAPLNLGTKRACPKCATKFYDFGKDEPVCPKCETQLDLSAVNPRPPAETKKSAKAEKESAEEAVLASSEELATADSEFESIEDLEDDEEEIVEDIVDEEENESF